VVITVTAACPALVTEAGAASLDTGLVPTINIMRVPYWGRAAETFGEDPYLISQMAVGTCRAMIGDSFQ
jgi:beta-glucosidase